MKRDWDVIRSILISIENLDAKASEEHHYNVQEDDEQRTAEHAVLLWKAGFIEGLDGSAEDGAYLMATGLTWQGHDLLETMRSKPVWERIKVTAQEKGIELTFDAVKKLGALALDAVLGN